MSHALRKTFMVGSDTEVFIKDVATDKIISIEGKLGGTKYRPRPLYELGDGFAVQEDNIMAEFNIPPAKTRDDFVEYMSTMRRWFGKNLKNPIVIIASAELDADQLQTDQAMTFGCEPDFNAWRGLEQNPDIERRFPNLRTCGGHIHVGWDNPTIQERQNVIRWMDCLLGVRSVWEDEDRRRRIMYGKAGACRVKPYGVEYRVLSNYWFASDELVSSVYINTQAACSFATSDQTLTDEMVGHFGAEIQRVINNVDVKAAIELETKIQEWLAAK